MCGCLGPDRGGGDGPFFAQNHVAVEGVLHVRARVGGSENALLVRVVFRKEPRGRLLRARRVHDESVVAKRLVAGEHAAAAGFDRGLLFRAFPVLSPAPDIAEPQRGQDVDRRGLGTAVSDGDAPEHVFRGALGDLLDDIEIFPVVEEPHVGEFQLGTAAAEFLVFLADRGVGKCRLRIFVERLGVRVGGRGIEVVVALLHVLAVVSLVTAEAEEALLEDGVVAIP